MLKTQEFLDARIVRRLQKGGRCSPEVTLMQGDYGDFVLKDFSHCTFLVRKVLGRFVTSQEIRAYRVLGDHPSVPRLLGRIGEQAFAVEYRPGRRMSRLLRGKVGADFLDRLERAVRQMHSLGVVHLDLRHRSNVLVDDNDEPVLIDFASALYFRPGSWWARHFLAGFARIDLSALEKWRDRVVGPDVG